MSKLPPVDPELFQQVLAAVERCAGNVVVGQSPEGRLETARVALRRIRSFSRRNVSHSDRAAQIRDIARGLIERFERDPKLVGPLIIDYELVAREILDSIQRLEGRTS